MNPVKDFDAYEFKSPMNVWEPQKKYLNAMDKLKFLEFDVPAGYVLYIPPYWWYSFKFSNENITSISSFTYNTTMNIVSNSVDLIKYFLQQQNITKKPIQLKKEETIEEIESSPNPSI